MSGCPQCKSREAREKELDREPEAEECDSLPTPTKGRSPGWCQTHRQLDLVIFASHAQAGLEPASQDWGFRAEGGSNLRPLGVQGQAIPQVTKEFV